MHQVLTLTSNTAALVGILLCAISGMARLAGAFRLAGYESTTLFMVGIGLMVFACLIKVDALSRQPKT